MPWTWFFLLLGGAVIGWIATVVGDLTHPRSILLLTIGGALAAGLGGLLVAPVFGTPINPAGFSLPNLLVALLGAFFLLGAVIIARRMLPRR